MNEHFSIVLTARWLRTIIHLKGVLNNRFSCGLAARYSLLPINLTVTMLLIMLLMKQDIEENTSDVEDDKVEPKAKRAKSNTTTKRTSKENTKEDDEEEAASEWSSRDSGDKQYRGGKEDQNANRETFDQKGEWLGEVLVRLCSFAPFVVTRHLSAGQGKSNYCFIFTGFPSSESRSTFMQNILFSPLSF